MIDSHVSIVSVAKCFKRDTEKCFLYKLKTEEWSKELAEAVEKKKTKI